MVPGVSSSQEISTCELGLLNTDDEVNDDLKDQYGPLCWQRFEADPGSFKK